MHSSHLVPVLGPGPLAHPAHRDETPRGPPSGTEQTLEAPAVEKEVGRKVYWGLVPFLFLTIVFIYLDRSNVSYAAPQLRADLSLSAPQFGFGAGLLFAGSIVAQVPLTLISVRNPQLFIATTLVIWGTVAACTAAIKSAKQFYFMRFLLGCAEAGAFPSIWYYLTSSGFTSSEELTVTWACSLSATAISQVIGAPIAAGLLYMDGLGNLRGWQWLFILEGLVTSVFGFILKLTLPSKPEQAWFLDQEERCWLQQRQEQHRQAALSANPHAGSYLVHALRTWRIWYLGAAWFPLQAAVFAVTFWTPLMLGALLAGSFSGQPKAPTADVSDKEQAVEAAKLALLSSVVFGPAGIAMVAVAYSSKRWGERSMHVGASCFCTGIALLLVPMLSKHAGAIPTVLAIAVAACGAWGVGGPVWSWPATFMHGPGSAVGVAIFNTFGALGGFVGPIIVGNLSSGGDYSVSMYVLGALSMISGLMFLRFPSSDHDK